MLLDSTAVAAAAAAAAAAQAAVKLAPSAITHARQQQQLSNLRLEQSRLHGPYHLVLVRHLPSQVC
jgi:ubiquinone biosynthesis protein UbiJ